MILCFSTVVDFLCIFLIFLLASHYDFAYEEYHSGIRYLTIFSVGVNIHTSSTFLPTGEFANLSRERGSDF